MRIRTLLLASLLLLLTSIQTSFAQWVEDGLPVCTAAARQYDPKIIADGAGGALITWYDMRTGDGDIYVQRVDGLGNALWTPNGVALYVGFENQQDPVVVSDGAGGAIVIWVDHRDTETNGGDVYCRRINASGTPMWNANGVPLCVMPEDQVFLNAISDGAGGAIVAWSDERNGTDYDIYVQRVDGSGNVQWAANGVPIVTEAGTQFIPGIVSDGAGGAILAWSDGRTTGNTNAYAQRINASGVTQWTEDGIALCTAPGTQRNMELVSDFLGGAIVTWWDARSGAFDIYCQRVSASGVPQWTANGVAVCTATNEQFSAVVAPSGNGGVLISWLDSRNGTDYDAYVQFVNYAGVPTWTIDGVKLCDAAGDQAVYAIGSDGSGGAVVAWGDGRNDGGVDFNYDIYARRVSNTGALMWTTDGVLLCDAPHEQQDLVLLADGSGGALMAWVDDRVDSYDIYAQRVLSNGEVPIVPTAVSNRVPSLRVGDAFPNPFANHASIDIELSTPTTIEVDVFDVAGRAVRSIRLPAIAGARRVAFDGRNEGGQLLPSGVYFYRVKAAGETITRKMVIAR